MRRMLTTLYRPLLTMLLCIAVTLIAVVSSNPSHSDSAHADPTSSATASTYTPTPSPVPTPSRTAPAFPSPSARLVHHATPVPEPTIRKHPASPAHRPPRHVEHTRQLPVVRTGSARAYARSVLSSGQYACLDSVVTRESGWNVRARNPYSGAYGLGQALPGSKMASYGSDWRTSGITQIRWVIHYMNSRYGSPCEAWNFWRSHRWY